MFANRVPLDSWSHQAQEVAIASFGAWQIAIPTDRIVVEKQVFSATIPIPERSYLSQGWVIDRKQPIATLEGLAIRSAVAVDSPFRMPLRLGPGVPLDFELQSHQPLPAKIATAARFACNCAGKYYAVFRSMRPRFVRIYPFASENSIADAVRQLLAAEQALIADRGNLLKQVPFYCESFNLDLEPPAQAGAE
ncbi:MAG: hypothetical protein AAFY11_12605 [Cyanobacteria bacterium J06641_5]